jgi:hypothetical protein
VFLVSESLPETGPGVAEAIGAVLGEWLARAFGAAGKSVVVDSATPRVGW